MKGINGNVQWVVFSRYSEVCEFLNNPSQIGAQLVAICCDTDSVTVVVFYVPHNPKEGNDIGDDE